MEFRPIYALTSTNYHHHIGLGGDSGEVAIDMVNFQNISMDTSTWYATIGAGSKLGDVTEKLHDNGGRAFAHGVCPGVGLGGHATIVGFLFLSLLSIPMSSSRLPI